MKRLKRLFSVMLAMAMTLAMTMQVMAAGVAPTTDVTVTLPTDEILEGHTYTAYQIFTGIENPDKENALGDVKWGNGIDADAFMAALKASDKFETTNPFANVTDALDVSAVLGTITPAQAITVAQIAYEHITETGTVLSPGTNRMVSGYYLIVDTTTDVGEDGVYNAALLQATSNVNIQVKTDKPEVTKKIVESGNKVDYNNTAIGTLVNYNISSNVPDVTQYKNYKFKVVDTLSKGLTYNADSLSISINGTSVPAENYESTVSGGSNGEATVITILFKNCKTYFAGKAGQTLEITYNATLNEHAVIGVSGNDNKVKLEYSANPNEVGEGDEFDDDDVKGETPEDKVITYVTGIKITKVDGSNNEPLTGAQFQITGEKLEQGLVVGYEFVEAADGTYYRLKDGGYTTTAPTDSTKDKYANTETKYNKVDKTGLTILKKETVDFVAEVGEDGILSVAGLSAGTYVIKEIKAPDGYNILKDDIKLVITCNTAELNGSYDPLTQNDCTWTLEKTVGTGTPEIITSVDNLGLFAFDIQNNQGAELPETGGIGTTIFYIVGGILVVGAAILLITKKRMSKEA